MTNDEINIAIAEACGISVCWPHKWIRPKIEYYHPDFGSGPQYRIEQGYWQCIECNQLKGNLVFDNSPNVQDYCNDLNAMDKTALALPQHLRYDYTRNLRLIVARECDKPEYRIPDEVQLIEDFWFYHATARQRAEAFLRTLRKWKD